jgi:Zn-dependent protease with chaperone function
MPSDLAKSASLKILVLLLLALQCAASSQAASRARDRSVQAEPLQSYPVQQTPTQPAVPGSTEKSQEPPNSRRTEQYTLSQDRYQKAVAYSRAEYILWFLSYAVSITVLILFLRLGISARLRDLAERATGNRWLQGLLFVPLLILALDVFDLPTRIYGHVLSLRYAQSIQGWGSWLLDWIKGEALGAAFAAVLALILYRVMGWSPRRWWLYFWMAALPIIVVVIFLQPLVIDPLFYKFEPLQNRYPQLAGAMEKVIHRAGLDIPRERMFLMSASAKTNQVNAYVTGFGASKRVVVWDTTIQKMTPDETLFIFGHEAGHYVLNHIQQGFVFFSTLFLLALYIGYRGLHWALSRWGARWRLYGVEDWASLTVMLLLLQIMVFVCLPIQNGFTRAQEHAADIYGLEVIHRIVPNSEEVAAHAFQVLGEIDLADPNPPALITFWLYSHPPLADRLVFAHTYDPWSKGEPPKYVKLPAN